VTPARILSGFAIALAVSAVSGGCVSKQAYDELLAAHQKLRRVHEDMEASYTDLEGRARNAESELAQTELDAERYRQEAALASDKMEQIRQQLQDLESQRKSIEIAEGVTLFDTPDATIVRIADEILFDSGSDKIKSNARGALAQVAELLGQGTEPIQVEGHTDNDPIVKTKSLWPLGNLQLSAARALQVANWLQSEGKIRSDRVSIVGFGEWRPIAPNDSRANKAKNRRVEIKLIKTNVQ